MMIPAPLFHTTVVLTQGFDPEECLRRIAEPGVHTLIAVPTMVQCLVDVPAEVRTRYDLSSLRYVISCGAPLAAVTVDRVELWISDTDGAVRTPFAHRDEWEPDGLGAFVGSAVYRAMRNA